MEGPAPGATSGAVSGPGAGSLVEWLAAPRPEAAPGLWRLGYRPRDPEPDVAGDRRRLLVGLVVSTVLGLLFWSLWRHGGIPYQSAPLKLFTPGEWYWPGSASPRTWQGVDAHVVYDGVVFAALVLSVGRLGGWPDAIQRFVVRRPQPGRAAVALVAAVAVLVFVWPDALGLDWRPLPVVDPVLSLITLVSGGPGIFTSPVLTDLVYAAITLAVLWPFARIGGWWEALRAGRGRAAGTGGAPRGPAAPPRPTGAPAPAPWPELRAAGQARAADLLGTELATGRMNDVDCARVARVWSAAKDPVAQASFADTVARYGAAAWTHPSGLRDLPVRTATHDLLVGQVRIGRYAHDERNPYGVRGAAAALDPGVLGTSLLAVGPPGTGKTGRLMRPVTEALALQALTGQAAVVTVGAAGADLGPDDAYDVVVRPGDPASAHDLDLYAGCADPDEAAAFLAEGLVGDLDGVDTQRAAVALAQLLGPHHAAYGRFPTVPELRELLEGEPTALARLRAGLDAATPTGAASSPSHAAMRRELDARNRQAHTVGDPGPALADRLTLLDRPAFAQFFATGPDARPFSLRAVAHHPLRVRVDLPERAHEEASRLLARLLLAQFGHVVRAPGRGAHFACLVLDDAARTLTADSVRAIQRLRSADAGVVLGLRTVGEVPERLQGPLYAAVGCRMAFSGVTTWDGRRFAEAWGTEWVETTEVAQHTVFADQPMTRALHSLRKFLTGKAVTTDAVTVRQVERERWSASDLAHAVPPGHAVLSLTTVRGEHAPPLLVDLRDQDPRARRG
ncbi:ATP/GTP-binding protein [Streptomyces beihaiensis]|uniref:ATP/GTP-binding protein n=1 Tax=Streptomyces beihaiensis TaxID=2984495 RepID=A0ABT3U0W7_9ACTN|nr:ATP/GTP-binding protein [Streptomyces beihaiensis]MCX3062894.1 ATP/GTP-binding protein [Streptomyces beihaiensis]